MKHKLAQISAEMSAHDQNSIVFWEEEGFCSIEPEGFSFGFDDAPNSTAVIDDRPTPTFVDDDSPTSTIVCLKDVSANNLSGESWDSYYEHNISLSSSNYANTITNSWPQDARDCHKGTNWFSATWDSNSQQYIKYC
jgi:hypothetical protein